MANENNYYQVYTESIYTLAASLTLKCGWSAVMINEKVKIDGGGAHFNPLDETTWKYYLNVTGEYYATDEKMTIISLDNMQEILFSTENLKRHSATALAYAFGGEYYRELLDKYPDNETLIRGILYPCDMDTAINATDGTILSYPPGLIESTEYSFEQKLQDWIYGYISRWDAHWFTITDNLYKAAFWSTLFAALPGVISNIRLGACKTKEAHSYHVMQYLSSHSRLDRYVPYMTREQQMFFYRNIVHIERNSGKKDVFDWLVENLFTIRGLPIADFTFAHNLDGMMQSLSPTPFFNKNPINTASNMNGVDEYTLKQILDLEERIEPPNAKYREIDDPIIEHRVVNSLYNQAPTKVLESTVIDYTDSEKYRLPDIMLNHWIWFASQGLYTSFIRVTIPSQGVELSISVKDAVTLYTYAIMKLGGYTLDKLIGHRINHLQRLPAAEFDSLREVATTKRVDDEWIDEVMATMPEVGTYVSVQAFRDHCQKLYVASNLQWKMSCARDGFNERAQTALAYLRLWDVRKVYLGDEPDQSYTDWFASRNISLRDIGQDDWEYLQGAILAEALGNEIIETVSLRDIQNAMINTASTLLSYSVHISADINQGPVLKVGCVDHRYEFRSTKATHKLYYDVAPIRILDLTASAKANIRLNFPTPKLTFKAGTWSPKIKYKMTRMFKGRASLKSAMRFRMHVRADIRFVKNSTVTTTEGRFDTLTREELASIPSAWDYPDVY